MGTCICAQQKEKKILQFKNQTQKISKRVKIFDNIENFNRNQHKNDWFLISNQTRQSEQDLRRLTIIQNQAIKYMSLKSQREHNLLKSTLQQRVKKIGFSIQDLNKLHHYILYSAPIIIHVHISQHMTFFIKDTHYRNQFQTNKSSGTLNRQTRINWEDRMFDKKYLMASDFQRVKYGVMNCTNDPKGVASCVNYGLSYFILKSHLRKRCTFADRDSGESNSSISTFEHCFPIIMKLNDEQLKSVFQASKGQKVQSNKLVTYKEIQIHGPIQFSKDIQLLMVNEQEFKKQTHLKMIQTFRQKFNVPFKYFSRNK